MKNLLSKFKSNLRTNIIILSIGLALGIAFFFLYVFLMEKEPSFRLMSDASFILMAVYLAVGGLMWIAHLGFFDTLAYGFVTMGNVFFRPTKIEKKYDDLIDYKSQKYAKRKSQGFFYLPFLMLGILAIIVAIVFYILYSVNVPPTV